MPVLIRSTLLVVLCVIAVAVSAQESPPAELALTRIGAAGDPVALSRPWRFHPGDDPRWAAPAFDDRGWEVVEPHLPPGSRPRGGWRGAGWFRRHAVVTDGGPVTLSIEGSGQALLYLDGAPILQNRGGSAAPHSAGAWTLIDIRRGPHLFAVRYQCNCGGAAPIGFRLVIDRPDAAAARAVAGRRQALLFGAFAAIPAVLGVLHLALFVFYRKARENLFCALCMLSLALIVAASVAARYAENARFAVLIVGGLFAGIASAVFFGLMTYAVVRFDRIPRSWVGFAIAGLLLPIFGPVLSGTAGTVAWGGYFGASLAEIIRMEVTGRSVRRESAMPLLVGILLLDAAIVAQILISLSLIPPPFGFDSVYLVGVLAFSLCTSLFVAGSFARTSIHLERRVVEIDAARTLQRSILPRTVPLVLGLDVAANVTTATEVGGDYYDFRAGGDGSLTIAIGDAAGHGVAAGAMVTATKALFASMEEESLSAMLSKCDRVLRSMNVRPLYMCLQLAHVTPRSIRVASAAMPRPLHFRALDGRAEEIAVGGLPLASALLPAWGEETQALARGDALLFASDGLAEALSPAGDPLGYERIASSFAAVARGGASAREILDALMAEADTWRGTRGQNDDIAMVAVRVA